MPLVLAPILVGFFAFMAAMILLGLSQTHTATQGGAGIQGFLDFITGKTYIRELVNLAKQASRALLSRFAAAQVKHAAGFLASLGWLIGYTYKTNATTARATADAMERLHQREKADVRQLHRAEARLRATTARDFRTAEHGIHHVGHELDAYKARTQPEIKALRHAIDVTLPRDIARVRTREEALSRDQAKLRERTGLLERGAERTFEWIRTHPLSAVTGVFAGAVAVALSRLGFGFLRCRSWQNLGRSLTCNDANILADLLAAATLVVGAMSLVELAREEQKVVGEAANLIRGFWEA